jgi:hypothetical protein
MAFTFAASGIQFFLATHSVIIFSAAPGKWAQNDHQSTIKAHFAPSLAAEEFFCHFL